MPDVVVITGASAGVGRATAKAFGSRGDHVALIARGRAGLEAAAAEVRAAGGTAITVPCDVSDPEAVEAATARAGAAPVGARHALPPAGSAAPGPRRPPPPAQGLASARSPLG